MKNAVPLPKDLTLFQRVPEEMMIGRKEELANLRKILNQEQKACLIKGIEGIGKTTLAAVYASLFYDLYHFIVWLDASESIDEAILTNYHLQENLGLTNLKASEKVEVTLKHLSALHPEKPGLLVIDDAKINLSARYDQLPASPHWHILVTSREQLSRFQLLELGFLPLDEAVDLFQEFCKGFSTTQVRQLLQMVELHPLLLRVMAKSLCYNHVVFENADRILRTGSSKGITSTLFDHKQEDKIRNYLSVLPAFLDHGENESWLLKQFLALPSFCIHLDTLKDLLEVDQLSWGSAFEGELENLSGKGLLFYDQHLNCYLMHRMIRKALSEKIRITTEDINPLIKKIAQVLQSVMNSDGPGSKYQLVKFGESILKLFPENMTREISYLKDILADVYKEYGEFERARELIEDVLKAGCEQFGEDHPEIASLQTKLAQVYRDLGEFEEARDLFETALQSTIRNYGDEHPDISLNHTLLANVYKDLGEFEKARDLLINTLKADLRNYPQNHPFISKTQSNLAAIYKNLGEPEKALELLEKSLATDLANFGENHPTVSTSRANLATLYRDLGENEKARDLLESALKSDIPNLGEKHPDVAIRQTILANVYSGLGEHEKAKYLWEKALRTNIEFFGQNHPNVALCQSNLAGVCAELGEYEKAKELLEEGLKSDLINFGEKHPYVALCQSNLANVYYDLGEYENSRSLFEKTLLLHEEIYEPDHPFTNQVQANLANVYADLGEFEKARVLLEKNLTSDLKRYGDKHPNVAVSQSLLANLYADIGETEKAREIWLSAFQILASTIGTEHPDTKMVKGFLDETRPGQG